MPNFNGLIQHSFALRNHELHRPLRGGSIEEIVAERFALTASEGAEFRVRGLTDQNGVSAPSWSPLVERELTSLDPHARTNFLEWNPEEGNFSKKLPDAFSWADEKNREKLQQKHWERFIFAKNESGHISLNDFLVSARYSGEGQARSVSEMICELLAARRSMLFGLSLANRFVNVTLPHAFLTPVTGHDQWRRGVRAPWWLLQPLVSLIRVGRDGNDFRRMYSLSFFLIPVKNSSCEPRKMSEREIEGMVNAGWGLASSPSGLSLFDFSGPLLGYVSRLTPPVEHTLDPQAPNGSPANQDDGGAAKWRHLTLRQATEEIAFAMALRMAQGSNGVADKRARQLIGDEVVTSLGNSRMSSVVVVDKKFRQASFDGPPSSNPLPGALGPLMRTLAREVRIPSSRRIAQSRKYRLDRAYIDHGNYVIGVLPSNRCLVVTSDQKAQSGRWESGLMQAGWMAYTVIASASAIGTMRAINRDLETVKRSDPTKIAELEHDVAVDLHEIYDLDITWEAYRLRYRRLREQLGITSDYKALHGKLEALYRETSAHFEARTQRRLVMLTAAIVVLSVFILVATIVTVLK